MPKLTVVARVRETGAPIPWVYVEVDGVSGATGADGSITFQLPPRTYVVKIRAMEWRPWTASIDLTQDRTIVADLERAKL